MDKQTCANCGNVIVSTVKYYELPYSEAADKVFCCELCAAEFAIKNCLINQQGEV